MSEVGQTTQSPPRREHLELMPARDVSMLVRDLGELATELLNPGHGGRRIDAVSRPARCRQWFAIAPGYQQKQHAGKKNQSAALDVFEPFHSTQERVDYQ